MDRNLILLSLATMCAYGCVTAPTDSSRWVGYRWAYIGSDATFKSSQVFDEALIRKFKQGIDAAKDNCARETGESVTPGRWLGYSNAFMACMKAQGWRPGSGI